MTVLSPAAAYQLWAESYDRDPNPVLALERRILSERLRFEPGDCVIDLATGTGHWLDYALSRGARAFGVDASPWMLAEAAKKQGCAGRLALGDLCLLPFANDAADLTICSFAISYISDVEAAFSEIARVTRRAIVTDLHPRAEQAGWARSFRASGGDCEIAHHAHTWRHLRACAQAANLAPLWSMDAHFGEPERVIFDRAGKGGRFDAIRDTPAVLISAWERAC